MYINAYIDRVSRVSSKDATKIRSQHCRTAATGMSSQGSAASLASSAASMPPPGLHTSNSSFFKSYITKVDANSRQKCSLCTKDWSSTTNIVNMEPHFQSTHHQIWKQRPRRESPPSQTIADSWNNADNNAAFDGVVELFIHHPALFLFSKEVVVYVFKRGVYS